jgi:two-component system OmpR family sensor kinase
MPTLLRGIRVRLALLIIIAMAALFGMVVYQEFRSYNTDRKNGDENIQRLAVFAAQAQRERFEGARRLLKLGATSGTAFRNVAERRDQESFDACTRGLFVLDQLLPETTGFTLWDPAGNTLCSSEAAAMGEYSAGDRLWFQLAKERGEISTGSYGLSPPDDAPNIDFGTPILDATGENVVAYLSVGLGLTDASALLPVANLPDTGRVRVLDQNGTVIAATDDTVGETADTFVERFGSLSTALESKITDNLGGDRRLAAVRITDEGDTAVSVLVGADKDVLAEPLQNRLISDLTPLVLITLLSLVAVWILAQRWVVKPVSDLVGATEAVAAGNLGARAHIDAGVVEFERLAASFNEMAATRQQATYAKDEFLGLVSHELKTPITTVLGNAAVLEKRGHLLDEETRQIALEDIHQSAVRLNEIIENLLTLARLERGAALEGEPIAMCRLAESVVEAQLRRTPDRAIVVAGGRDICALGGETYVIQVLQNLVANAIKYSPADAQIDVVVAEEDGAVVTRVLDRGAQIPDAEREAIFQPFYRSTATSAFAEGVGIGLSVCRRLITSMNGSLWTNNRPGGGTEFGFRLPLVSDEEASAADPERADEGSSLSVAPA